MLGCLNADLFILSKTNSITPWEDMYLAKCGTQAITYNTSK